MIRNEQEGRGGQWNAFGFALACAMYALAGVLLWCNDVTAAAGWLTAGGLQMRSARKETP